MANRYSDWCRPNGDYGISGPLTGPPYDSWICIASYWSKALLANKAIQIPNEILRQIAFYVAYNGHYGFKPWTYIIPRSINLLTELAYLEAGKHKELLDPSLIQHNEDEYRAMCVTLALDNWDTTLTHWIATIIPAGGTYVGDRIYSLKINVCQDYPFEPPMVRFVQKVAIPYVNAQGIVEIDKMNHWKWHINASLFEMIFQIARTFHSRADQPSQKACSRIPMEACYI